MRAGFITPTGSSRERLSPVSPPGPRLVVLPRDQVVIHDNWQVAGLKGTGSCDFSIKMCSVPEEMTCSLMDVILGKAITGSAARSDSGYLRAWRLSISEYLSELPGALWMRSQRRRLQRAAVFRPLRCRVSRIFQFALGKAETELASARALAVKLLSELYIEAQAGGTPAPARQAGFHIRH
jgi:indole-3-acetate monooxygenase